MRKPNVPCIDCGKMLWSGSTTRPDDQRVCRQCDRAKRPHCTEHEVWILGCTACASASERARYRRRHAVPEVEVHTCRSCQSTWTRKPTRGQVPTYCPDCRAGRRFITCIRCGERAAVTYKASGRYCSQACVQRDRAGWSTSTELVHVGPVDRPRRKPRPEPKRTDWWQFLVHGPCAHCGEDFTGMAASIGTAPIFCSTTCAKRAAAARRRARERDAFVEHINRRRIFERDRWICQLCGKRVARTKKVPHDKAPVIDHIIPLRWGGKHERRNVQCAHFLCNSLKSDGGTDQLRLIG